MEPKIVIFTTPTCVFCRKAKEYFLSRRLKFKEIDVSKDPAAAQDMVRRSGQMGVPVILINNHVVVGFDVAKIERLLAVH
jgi:glutaredoxin-like YruB-family protein